MPGAVWARQGALVWHDLTSHFVRAEVAAAAGIDAAIGFPWFKGNELAGVVTLLLTASVDAPRGRPWPPASRAAARRPPTHPPR